MKSLFHTYKFATLAMLVCSSLLITQPGYTIDPPNQSTENTTQTGYVSLPGGGIVGYGN
jgi:hypothetical protein